MTEKKSIAGTPLTAMEPEIEAKENRKVDEFEVMRNDPGLQRSIAEREEDGAALGLENSLEEDGGPGRARRRSPPVDLPPGVRKSYVEVNGKYFFADRPDSLAFEDRGRRLRTRLNHTRVAGSMVDIAEAKGWSRIRVRGEESFRREVWLQAAARGLAVRGFSPRDEDLARLKKLVRERPGGDVAIRRADEHEAEPVNSLAGRLVEHGRAPYKHNEGNRESYFVTLENADGKQSTTWGVDLERAVSESGAKEGDLVELENQGRRPVTVERLVKDDQGNVIRREKVNTHRNQWEVKAEALLNEKEDLARLARENPDLLNEIAVIKMGEKLSRNFRSDADRERFMELVRERIAGDYLQGRQAPPVKIREERAVERPDREKEVEHDR